jgi:hypothetical protein
MFVSNLDAWRQESKGCRSPRWFAVRDHPEVSSCWRSHLPSCSVPLVTFDITVIVVADEGTCVLQNDVPASSPTIPNRSEVSPDQNPKP